MAATVLLVDDEKNILLTLSQALQLEGYRTELAASGQVALDVLQAKPVDAVVMDVKMPDMDGLTVLGKVAASHPRVPVIMMSGHATIDTAVKATQLGAREFLEKPIGRDRLLVALRNALQHQAVMEELAQLRAEVGQFEMVGRGAEMARIYELIRRIAPSEGRVLVTGENGTGKELIARAVHQHSRRKTAPFVKLNCAAVPHELIESELFGHERGAFTGAVSARRGKFELAHEGTLFLDEIGDMPQAMQAKLLRVLQEGELERVGGTETIKVDVRVIAATNKDLEREISEGRFREDLYYRINVVQLHSPPLRERKEDLPDLIAAFLKEACSRNGKRPMTLTGEALNVMAHYDYPGNVRELRNLVERLAILCEGPVISGAEADALLPRARTRVASSNVAVTSEVAAPSPTPTPPPPARAGSTGERVQAHRRAPLPRSGRRRRTRDHPLRARAHPRQRDRSGATARSGARPLLQEDEGARDPPRGGAGLAARLTPSVHSRTDSNASSAHGGTRRRSPPIVPMASTDTGHSMRVSERGSSSSAAAAAAAARQAEEARRRAEEARKQAEAAKNTAQAEAAAKKLQAAEERVALRAKAAEDAMRQANVAAKSENKPEPYSAKALEKGQLAPNEVKNAFDGASARKKEELAKALGVDGSATPEQIAKELSADRHYAALAGDPKNRPTLEQLGIKDGRDLVKLGDQVQGQLQRNRTMCTPAPDFSKIGDKDALARILERAGETREGEARKVMTNRTFASLVARGVSPQEASQSPLDKALNREVDLETVAETKSGLESEVKQTREDLQARTRALSELASHPEKLPPGMSVEESNGWGTTLVSRDEDGRVLERTRFGDRDDMTYVSTQRFDRETGRVEIEGIESRPDLGTLESTRQSWKDKDLEAASKISSTHDLAQRITGAPEAASSSRLLTRSENGSLEEKTRTEDSKNGITETTRTFGTQKGLDGLNDQLEGKFDDGRPLVKVDTRTVHIPPPGTKDPDGKEARASLTFGTSWSQDNVRATASESRLVDRPEKRSGESSYPSGHYIDTDDVAYRAEKENGSPKTWTLQTSAPGELNTQTFVEGSKDLSVTTRARLEGNTVTETTRGKVPNPGDPGGDPVDISGVASRTYDDEGRLTAAHSDQTDAAGTRTVQDYQRTEERTAEGMRQVRETSTSSKEPKDGPALHARSELTRTFDSKDRVVGAHLEQRDEQGTRTVQDYAREEKRNAKGELEIHENTTSSREPTGGPKSTLEQRQVSVETPRGPELVRASNEITTPDGTAQDVISPEGQTLTVNGKKVDSLDALKSLPREQAALGAAAVDGLSQQVRDFNDLALALAPNPALAPDKVQTHDVKEVKAAAAANTVGLLRLKESLTPALNGQPSLSLNPSARLAGGAGGIASIAGGAEVLVKAGPLFMRDLSQGNYLGATKDGVALATGAIGIGGGGSSVWTAAKGAGSGLTLDGKLITAGGRASPAQVARGLNGIAKLSMGLGVLSGGMQVYDGIQAGNGWAIASGVTTAGAAVGGYLAAGAAAGAWGGPAGAGVGLAIGLAAWGMTRMFDHFDRSEFTIAEPTI